ncbi:MAG: hypothetical protein U0894_01060 [Pirellulales bacterium]
MQIAKIYSQNGACISVLTDEKYFPGKPRLFTRPSGKRFLLHSFAKISSSIAINW